MKARTWVILGATSIIAEEFAHLAAKARHSLLLVARNIAQLEIIAADIRLRYKVNCDFLYTDFSADLTKLSELFRQNPDEYDLFIAFSAIFENHTLDKKKISELIRTNILGTTQLINTYLQKDQTQHRLIFLSSVAACRGRAKNSLYGGSKAAIEIYLEGLQQTAKANLQLTIARLGFIDTSQTFGLPGIFYASPPKACAKACWRASYTGKRLIYHPFFWRYIMWIIKCLPHIIYKRMGNL
jgi:short-subunit dehydrogenase